MRHRAADLKAYLPRWAYVSLSKAKSWMVRPMPINLVGDRAVEWSFVSARIPDGSGKSALDFGPGASHLSLVAAERGYEVTAIDLVPVIWPYKDSRIRIIRDDILTFPLKEKSFDLVINCSSVEHVGLVGRYGVREAEPHGDLQAMVRLRELLKPDGLMLLTIPVGTDAVFPPYCRVYGHERLPLLLSDFTVEEERYWVKDDSNKWIASDRDTALSIQPVARSSSPLQTIYALGTYVLRRPQE